MGTTEETQAIDSIAMKYLERKGCLELLSVGGCGWVSIKDILQHLNQ